jgi:hypothetical protein
MRAHKNNQRQHGHRKQAHLTTLKANKKRALEAELDEAVLWYNSNKKKARCKATAEHQPCQLRRRLDAKSKVIKPHEGNQMLTCHERLSSLGGSA